MLYCLGHFLDPQRKGIICEMVYKNLKQVKEEVVRQINVTINNNNEPEDQTATPESEEPSDPLEQLFRLKNQQQGAAVPSSNPVIAEIEKYEALPKAKASENILEWWLNQKENLPLLFKVAQKVLGIPVSSSKSERVFSTSGLVIYELLKSELETLFTVGFIKNAMI